MFNVSDNFEARRTVRENLRQFDGSEQTLSLEARHEAVNAFTTLMDETLLKHARAVELDSTRTFPSYKLQLRTSFSDGSGLEFELALNDLGNKRPLTDWPREIIVYEMDDDGKQLDEHMYYVPYDRTMVIRHDFSEAAIDVMEDMERRYHEADDITAREVLKEYADESSQNSTFEDTLGLNNQPVDYSEIAKLRLLLDQAVPIAI